MTEASATARGAVGWSGAVGKRGAAGMRGPAGTSGAPTAAAERRGGLRSWACRLLPSIVLVAALSLAGFACHRSDPAATAGGVPSEARIDSLRACGAYEEALLVARAFEARLRADGTVPAWRRVEARLETATLARLAAQPESLRVVLAHADRASAVAESLVASGALPAARALVETQLAARRRVLAVNDPEIAASLERLARIHREEGNVWEAFELDEEALAVRQRAFGPEHPRVAESLDALGLDTKGVGRPREALELGRRAAAMQRRLLGPDSGDEMATLLNIANVHRVLHQPDSALAVFGTVLSYHGRAGAPDSAAVGQILFGMAMTLIPDGRWAEAEPLLAEAVGIQRTLGPREQVWLGRSLAAYGSSLRHLGRPAEAEVALHEASRLWERLRAAAAPGPIRSIVYSLASYGMLAAAQLECGHEARAWQSLERSLARSLVEDLVARGAVDTTGWWDDPLPRVQATLRADEAIVGWLALRPGATREGYPFWGYCLRSDGPVRWTRFDRPEGGPAAADRTLLDLVIELNQAAGWPLRIVDTDRVRRLGRDAYEQRFALLEPSLAGVRHLVVLSPNLNYGCSLASWIDREGRWLGDRFELTHAPSALLYAETARSAANRPDPPDWRALLVGGSRLDSTGPDGLPPAAGEEQRAAIGTEIHDVAALVASAQILDEEESVEGLRELATSDALGEFDLIHFAAHGVVDSWWLGRSALVLTASDSMVRTEEIAADPADSTEQLAMGEVATWRLDADLVTLAACASMRGLESTTDGFLGLPYACLAAGARQVVGSLWPVDDEATVLLMQRFYECLVRDEHEGPAAAREAATESASDRSPRRVARALREASIWLRGWQAEDGSTPYAHPVYWSGFVSICGGQAAASTYSAQASP